MKQLVLLLLVVLIEVCIVNAQELNESQIPEVVKNLFQKKYPDIKARWDREGASYEANFTHTGRAMSTVIDRSGKIVEREIEISVSELPPLVRSYIKKNYPGSKITDAAKIVSSNGDLNYEVGVHDKDVVFDVNGKFIEAIKD